MSSEQKGSFFKQSGWMVIATFVGGIFMMAVHPVAIQRISKAEYGVFVALLRVMLVLTVPAVALQTVFAHQTVGATDETNRHNLAATTRSILKWTFAIWVLIAVGMIVETKSLCSLLKVTNPAALWLTIPIILTSLWAPIFKGLLQGEQKFGPLGGMQIIDGIGRLSGTAIIVFFLGGKVAGAILAAVVGQVATIIYGAIMTRKIWSPRNVGTFSHRAWLNAVMPLTLGTGTIILMSSFDMLFVQSVFWNEKFTGLYAGAMYTGFAMTQFIAPITSVMFARIARSTVLAQNSNALTLTVGITAAFAVLAAIGCTLFPELPLRIMFAGQKGMLQAAPLVKWYCWALVPLTVANVLVQNVLARSRFEAVPWLVVVPAAFVATLFYMAPKWSAVPQTDLDMVSAFGGFKGVIVTLGAYSGLLCLIAAWFSWGKRRLPV